jgi:AcrR family transcriptional regulator
MNTKGDDNRSVRETKQRIKQAFLELVEVKTFSKISVKEITERAHINRTTFYLHYQDVYDLLDKIEDRIARDIKNAVNSISRENYVPGQHPQHTAIFEALEDHRYEIETLMTRNGDVDLLYKLAALMHDVLRNNWSRYAGDSKASEVDLYASYIVYGIIGVFIAKIQNEHNGDAGEMGFIAGEVTNWIDETFVRE